MFSSQAKIKLYEENNATGCNVTSFSRFLYCIKPLKEYMTVSNSINIYFEYFNLVAFVYIRVEYNEPGHLQKS